MPPWNAKAAKKYCLSLRPLRPLRSIVTFDPATPPDASRRDGSISAVRRRARSTPSLEIPSSTDDRAGAAARVDRDRSRTGERARVGSAQSGEHHAARAAPAHRPGNGTARQLTSVSFTASSVASILRMRRGCASASARPAGFGIARPMIGSTISANFAGCAVARKIPAPP